MTMLILLGPAIEDAAVGKDVVSASAIRVAPVHRGGAVCMGHRVGAPALACLEIQRAGRQARSRIAGHLSPTAADLHENRFGGASPPPPR